MKTIKTLLLTIIVIAMCLFVASCSNDQPNDDPTPPEETPHEHTIVIDKAVAPACEIPGLTEGSHCSVCNEVIVPQTTVDALKHTFYDADGKLTGGVIDHDNNKITYKCNRCNKIVSALYEETDTSDKCLEVHNKANLEAHNIEYIEVATHAAESCKDSNYKVFQCQNCECFFSDDTTVSDIECKFEITQHATCNQDQIKKCRVCDREVTTSIDVPHSYVAATPCGENQTTTRICEICGDENNEGTINLTHTWNITVTKEPTCGTPGEATYKCTYCGFTKTATIVADAYSAGHNWVFGNGQDMNCSKSQDLIIEGYYCKECNISAKAGQVIVVDNEKVTNATEYAVILYSHDMVLCAELIKPATCTTPESLIYKCSQCDYWVERGEPALGHVWEREGAEPLDITKIEPECVKCTADNVGKYIYRAYCADCATDVVVIEAEHKLTANKIIAPTCQDDGYTCDYCEICDVAYNKTNFTDPVATNHVWYTSKEEADADGLSGWYIVTKKPTCTTPGVAKSGCKLCGRALNENMPIAPTMHDYYVIENGNTVYQGGVYDCSNGKITYTCTKCDEKEPGHTFSEVIPGYDFDDLSFHTGTLTEVKNHALNNPGSCTVNKVTVYICSEHAMYIIVDEGVQHNMVVEETPSDATCTNNGKIGFAYCTNCTYTEGVKGGVILALGHAWDENTYSAPVEATCTTDGNKGYGVCLRDGCTYTFGEAKEEDRVIEKLGHDDVLVDYVGNATCTEYAYDHYICQRCNAEKWENYRVANGHTFEITSNPTHTTIGEQKCTTCGHTEIIARIPHVDADGNAIECVIDDFYCHECCEPIFDPETKEFTGKYNKDPISWKESHYDVTEDSEDHYCNKCNMVLN